MSGRTHLINSLACCRRNNNLWCPVEIILLKARYLECVRIENSLLFNQLTEWCKLNEQANIKSCSKLFQRFPSQGVFTYCLNFSLTRS